MGNWQPWGNLPQTQEGETYLIPYFEAQGKYMQLQNQYHQINTNSHLCPKPLVEINGVCWLKTIAHASKLPNPLFGLASVPRDVKLFCKPQSTQSLQAITWEVLALLPCVVSAKHVNWSHTPYISTSGKGRWRLFRNILLFHASSATRTIRQAHNAQCLLILKLFLN